MMREEQRRKLYRLLGKLPSKNYKVASRCISIEEEGNLIIERLMLDLNGIEPVPAVFISLKDNKENSPVILFNHSHGGNYDIGKEELLSSSSYMYKKSYAEELTECGYKILAIDNWGFGERHGRTESEIFKKMLWNGRVMWGMMVYDNLKAIDYLFTRNDINTERIGTLGMSMGSTMAWWISALDTRIKVCVDICCMTDYECLLDDSGLDFHGIYYYVPDLINHFSTTEINALISPRAHLSLNGIFDKLTPLRGLDKIDKELRKIYSNSGFNDKFELKKYFVGHKETAEMRNDIINFLRRWL